MKLARTYTRIKQQYIKKINHLLYDTQILFRFKYPGMFYKDNLILRITELIRESITGWKRDLIWCPSQLNKIIVYNGNEYLLYARWRWDDPWTGYIIIRKEKGIKVEQLWSEELLSQYNFKDYDIRKVERKMDKLFRNYVIHKVSNLEFK